MSEKPHTVAIGAFVLGALLIGVTTVFFVLGTGMWAERSKVVMVFEGSVKGLNLGAPVALRGVEIGQVTSIELIVDSETSEFITQVEAQISGRNIRRTGTITDDLVEELIRDGLRAQLNSQSLLTGLLYVQLDFHPESELKFAQIDSPYIQIPTIPTGLERLTRELESIDIVEITSNLETISKGLASFVGDEDFQQLPGQLRETVASLQTLSTQLQDQVDSTGTRLDTLLDNTNGTVDLANRTLPELAELVRQDLQGLDRAIRAFETGMQDVSGLVDYDSATVYRLNQALEELARAGRALQQLGRALDEQPESLIRGRSEE